MAYESGNVISKFNSLTENPYSNLMAAIIGSAINTNDMRFFDTKWGIALCDEFNVDVEKAKYVTKMKYQEKLKKERERSERCLQSKGA